MNDIKPVVIIVHGAFGHPNENWFGWLQQQLLQHGIECIVPQFPTPVNHTLENWLNVFTTFYDRYERKQLILIGHSLGALFLLRAIETLQIKNAVVYLVGVFAGKVGVEKFDTLNKTFVDAEFDWASIKSGENEYICIQGSDDPYITMSSFHQIADQLKAKKIIISNGGHLNAAAGYTKFPLLLSLLETYTKK